MPLLQPGWTLNFEMFFYAIFAMTLFASATAHRVSILVLTLTALVAAGWTFEPSGPLLATYTSPLLLEFAFGAIIGQLYATGRLERFAKPVGWLMIYAGVVVCALGATYIVPRPLLDFHTEPLRVVTYGLGGALVVVGALSLEPRGKHAKPRPLLRWLQLLGDASYALYLTHLFSIAAARMVWVRSGMGTEGLSWTIAFLAVALPAAAAAGLAYWLLERPLTLAAQRMLLGTGSARAAPRSIPGEVG
jgi:exopolysaccharide production protein ExoZ